MGLYKIYSIVLFIVLTSCGSASSDMVIQAAADQPSVKHDAIREVTEAFIDAATNDIYSSHLRYAIMQSEIIDLTRLINDLHHDPKVKLSSDDLLKRVFPQVFSDSRVPVTNIQNFTRPRKEVIDLVTRLAKTLEDIEAFEQDNLKASGIIFANDASTLEELNYGPEDFICNLIATPTARLVPMQIEKISLGEVTTEKWVRPSAQQMADYKYKATRFFFGECHFGEISCVGHKSAKECTGIKITNLLNKELKTTLAADPANQE